MPIICARGICTVQYFIVIYHNLICQIYDLIYSIFGVRIAAVEYSRSSEYVKSNDRVYSIVLLSGSLTVENLVVLTASSLSILGKNIRCAVSIIQRWLWCLGRVCVSMTIYRSTLFASTRRSGRIILGCPMIPTTF